MLPMLAHGSLLLCTLPSMGAKKKLQRSEQLFHLQTKQTQTQPFLKLSHCAPTLPAFGTGKVGKARKQQAFLINKALSQRGCASRAGTDRE